MGAALNQLAPVLDRGGLGLEDTQHGVHAGLHSDTLPVVHRGLVLAVTGLGAVHNAPIQLGHKGNIGGCVGVHRVLVVDGVRGQDGRHYGKDQQKQQDPRRHHGGLILTEAQERIGKVAPCLGLQLLIMQVGVHLNKGELLLRNLLKIFIHTHFFDPILIRGSIKP